MVLTKKGEENFRILFRTDVIVSYYSHHVQEVFLSVLNIMHKWARLHGHTLIRFAWLKSIEIYHFIFKKTYDNGVYICSSNHFFVIVVFI